MLLLLFSAAIVVVAALTATNLQPCLFVAVSVPGVCVLSELVIKVIDHSVYSSPSLPSTCVCVSARTAKATMTIFVVHFLYLLLLNFIS